MTAVEALWYARELDEYQAGAALKVLSLHDQVINIAAEGWPHLLMLASPALPRGPAVICLPDAAFAYTRAMLTDGAAGHFLPGKITLSAGGQNLAVAWRGRPYLSFAPAGRMEADRAGFRRALHFHWTRLRQVNIDSPSAALLGLGGGEAFFRQAIEAHFPPLVDSLLNRKKQDFLVSCRKLIGMGRGSTPTGDDLVYGAVIAYHYYRHMLGRPWRGPVFTDELYRQTSLLGRHMLEMGRRGLAAAVISELIRSVFQGRTERVLLESLLEIGYSSGYDIAVALFYMFNRAAEYD